MTNGKDDGLGIFVCDVGTERHVAMPVAITKSPRDESARITVGWVTVASIELNGHPVSAGVNVRSGRRWTTVRPAAWPHTEVGRCDSVAFYDRLRAHPHDRTSRAVVHDSNGCANAQCGSEVYDVALVAFSELNAHIPDDLTPLCRESDGQECRKRDNDGVACQYSAIITD